MKLRHFHKPAQIKLTLTLNVNPVDVAEFRRMIDKMIGADDPQCGYDTWENYTDIRSRLAAMLAEADIRRMRMETPDTITMIEN